MVIAGGERKGGPLPSREDLTYTDPRGWRVPFYFNQEFENARIHLRPDIDFINNKIFGPTPEGVKHSTMGHFDNGSVNGVVMLQNPDGESKGFLTFDVMDLDIPKTVGLLPIGRERFTLIHFDTIGVEGDSRKKNWGETLMTVAIAGLNKVGISPDYAAEITQTRAAYKLVGRVERLGSILPFGPSYDKAPREQKLRDAFLTAADYIDLLDPIRGPKYGKLNGVFGRRLPPNRTVIMDPKSDYFDKRLINEMEVDVANGDGIVLMEKVLPESYEYYDIFGGNRDIPRAIAEPVTSIAPSIGILTRLLASL